MPEILEHDAHWLLISDLGHVTLEILIRHAPADERLAWWRRGADYIAQAST